MLLQVLAGLLEEDLEELAEVDAGRSMPLLLISPMSHSSSDPEFFLPVLA